MRPSARQRIILLGVLVSVVIFLGWIGFVYNSLVAGETTVQAQWAQVENQYQRKIDLIPNLVVTVSQYSEFESSTLQTITRLRSQWLNATGLEARLNITNALDQNLFRITVVYESYPDLYFPVLVISLMDELAGTENRITVERMRYNEQVRIYNTRIRSFPSNVIADWFGFRELGFYDPIPGGP
jgi:LemA protein